MARLAGAFAEWDVPPVHASMFGSAARGDGDAGSDIDLFVVRPAAVEVEDRTWRKQIDRLATDVGDWTGNRAGIADVAEQDLSDLVDRRPPLVRDLEADAITVAGPDISAILERKD